MPFSIAQTCGCKRKISPCFIDPSHVHVLHDRLHAHPFLYHRLHDRRGRLLIDRRPLDRLGSCLAASSGSR